MLTFFVGTNDYGDASNLKGKYIHALLPCGCVRCSGKFPSLTVDDYENHTREVLEEVRKNIPKVFVNLVLLGNISGVRSGVWL